MTVPPERLDEIEDPEGSSDLPAAALASHATPLSGLETRRGADREIWKLAWPAILSQVMASAVMLIDIAMIGRLGTEAIAAVGYSTQYLHLAQSVVFSLGTACVALMSRAIGADHPERARHALAASILLGVVLSGALSIVAVLFPAPLLRLLNAPESVVVTALPYFRLTIGSSALISVAIILESAFRAARDTRTPMVIAGTVTVVKIVLNAGLIFGLFGLPRLELVGAGLATVCSQVVAVVAFAVATRRSREARVLRLGSRDFIESRVIFREAITIALPAIGERAFMNFAIMTYFALLATYGSVEIAAYTVGVRILSFSWIPGTAFSIASATLVGQALGAYDADGAGRAAARAARMAVLVSFALGLFYALAREPLAAIFTNDAAVVVALGPIMLMLALAQPLMGLHFTLGGALRGAGDTVTPLLASMAGNWLLRVPIAFVCSQVLGLSVLWVWAALFFDHFVRSIWMVLAFRRGRWRTRVGASAHA